MLRFLCTHQDQTVVFPGPCGPDATEEEIESRFSLWFTMDSSHNACPDGKGITGITTSLGEWCTPFLCVAVKQCTVEMSTTDTEHYGFGEAVAKIRWVRSIAEFLGDETVQPIRVENDNMAALSLASMPFVGKPPFPFAIVITILFKRVLHIASRVYGFDVYSFLALVVKDSMKSSIPSSLDLASRTEQSIMVQPKNSFLLKTSPRKM